MTHHRRLVLGQGRALVELAADLPVKLTHAPAAAQCLSLIEPVGMVTGATVK